MNIKYEAKVKEGENLTLQKNMILNDKTKESVCQVKTANGYGSGFICKIKYHQIDEIYCLITNNHVLNENQLNQPEKNFIEIKLDNQTKKLFFNSGRKIWTNEKIDYTCIQILKEDNILENISTFEIDDNCYDENYNSGKYDKMGIVIPVINPKIEIELPQGIIEYTNINKYKFFHNCNTEPGNSGGPIILIKNLKIVGIHQGNVNKNQNIGIYFKEILNNINKKIIEGKLEIEKRDIDNKNNIMIFKSSQDIKNNVDIFLEEQKINLENLIYDKNKFMFSYNEFKKEGIYKFKIIFNNYIDINFDRNQNLIEVDLSNFDLSNFNNLRCLFRSCHKLKKIEGINKSKKEKPHSMMEMFKGCNELEYLNLTNMDTSNVNDMRELFKGCYKLKKIEGIKKFNTSNVLYMREMFEDCEKLENIDLSNFDTSEVILMDRMFDDCYNLKKINGLENFITEKVIDMKELFEGCYEIENLDLSHFKTNKVTTMEKMFNRCNELKKINGIEKFDTSQVTNMLCLFEGCKELENLDLSQFKTNNVTTMGGMFGNCNKLKKINGIEKFDTSQVTNMVKMFCNCNELENLDLSQFNTNKLTTVEKMFYNCTKLKKIKGFENLVALHVTNQDDVIYNCNFLV